MNYIQGVDRSHLNSPILLAKLVTEGVKFIWFKATQGATYQDPTFNVAWQEAKNTPGLIRGAYHFYNPQVDGKIQAQNFLSRGINFSASGCLPPCVDVEDLVGKDQADTAQLNKWVADNHTVAIQRLNDFLQAVKEQTGRDCIIYTYNNYPREYFRGYGFPNNEMWLSSLQTTCPNRYDKNKLPAFWQYTYGWNKSDMDGNYFTGTQDELNNLANINLS
jgi:lysozyme